MDFNQNYFEIFGLPVSYEVDVKGLADRFRELQREMHPDRFAASTEHEKRLSMQWSSLINTAHDTIKAPLPRAIYMMTLKGREVDHNPVLPPAFLMEQIELREELEALEDDPAGLEKLDAFKARVREVTCGIETEFGEVVDADEDRALVAVYELQFMTRLLDAANHLEEKLLDY